MKFELFVEGYTERALPLFLKRWLDPMLAHPVAIETVQFPGSSDYLKTFAKRAKKSLAKGRLIAIIGLRDLYGAGLDLPRDSTTDVKCAWAKRELESRVGDSRFRQHFAVHEVEAWLLSNPSIFPTTIRLLVQSLSRAPEPVDSQEPPSKLLRRLYRAAGRDYEKVADGAALFGNLDPDVARGRCPHLERLLNDMLILAKDAGL